MWRRPDRVAHSGRIDRLRGWTMSDELARVERLRRSHETQRWPSQGSEQTSTDASSILELRLAEVALRLQMTRDDSSVPATVIAIRHGLQAHFSFEESLGTEIFRKYGGDSFVTALLQEHRELLSRLDRVREMAADLVEHPQQPRESAAKAFEDAIALLKRHTQLEEEVLEKAENDLRRQESRAT